MILDVSPRGLNGIEVVSRMDADEHRRRLSVIALAAPLVVDDRGRYPALGFSDYISKPITDEQDLRDTIARLLGAAGPA